MELHRIKISRGWKDLAKEIGIVVVGVLLALLAEQTAQGIDQRQKVDAALRAMRAELTKDDGPQAWYRSHIKRCVDTSLDKIRTAVETDQSRADIVKAVRRYQVPYWTWDSMAFGTANASQVTLHLPTSVLQQWSFAYGVMPALEAANAREFTDGAELLALSTTGGPLSADEKSQILHGVEVLRKDNTMIVRAVKVALSGINGLNLQLDQSVVNGLSKQAVAYFGRDCLDPV